MRFWLRTFITALRAMRRNVMRSALTALGIIIGVAAVIAMAAIGKGSANAVADTIARMGANILLVLPGTTMAGGVNYGAGSTLTLTAADAQALEKSCSALAHVAPIVRMRTQQVIYGAKNWGPFYMVGTTPSYLEVREWHPLEEGSFFTEADVRKAKLVCVLGQTVVQELFEGESPIGKEVRVVGVPLRVVGVLTRKGANLNGNDQDDVLITPWTTMKYRLANVNLLNPNQPALAKADPNSVVNTLNQTYPGTQVALYPTPSPIQMADTPTSLRFNNIDQILTRIESTEAIPQATEEITSLLRERHRLLPGEHDDFTIRDTTEMNRALGDTSKVMASLLLGVALISLVVGGVGIMNIMLVSVTERTKEIGLRMAVGARPADILRQFLVESVLLCLIGGLLGIALGLGASEVVRLTQGWPTEVSWSAVATAVGVSAFVGVAFGYYPAWKASRLDPIDALRYE